MRFIKILEKTPRCDERVDDRISQLRDISMLADKIGCSKAAEFIRKISAGKSHYNIKGKG